MACTCKRQTGAALLMAMLTVTLVASFAAAAAWQQWRAIEVETAERQRVQASWILVGALDWARLILREDARSGGTDHLAEPWAVPLQESRLSSFLAADKNNVALSPEEQDIELFLSGRITDAQGLLNVTNLIENGKIHEPTLNSFAKLFDLLNLDLQELDALASNLRFATDKTADNQSAQSQFAPIAPQRFEQIGWLGVSPDTIERLTPFVTLLPIRAPVNINTASAEVLYASIPALDLAVARRMVVQRERQHFRTLDEAQLLSANIAGQIKVTEHSVSTRFFEVRGRLRLGQIAVQERSLVIRTGFDVRTLWRESTALDPDLEINASAASLQ